MRCRRQIAAISVFSLSRGHGAGDNPATEHAGLTFGRVIEDASLTGRNTILAANQSTLTSPSAPIRSHAGCGGRVERTFT